MTTTRNSKRLAAPISAWIDGAPLVRRHHLIGRADGGHDLRHSNAPPLHLKSRVTGDSNRFVGHGSLGSGRLLHDLDLRVGQAVQVVDQPVDLLSRRRDLPLQGGLGVGARYVGGKTPSAISAARVRT